MWYPGTGQPTSSTRCSHLSGLTGSVTKHTLPWLGEPSLGVLSSWTLRATAVTLEAQPSKTRLVEGETWPTFPDSPATSVGGFMGQAVAVNAAAKESHPECQDSKCGPGGLPVSLPLKKLPL